ncbi:hypothetical protein PHMEG_00028617 [Phytophthora megakarya]|uniref:Uncharacterized protein n=1 Tax=Phytophthora megakarya TaxID=4795 RepID=A0A225V636_9STRA|nr:hypothetical protein PHMEG_00028617 [Phytophthora megakarya]
MWKIWLRQSKTSEATRVRLYNCYVLPILLHNCGTWALTQGDLISLERFHCQQLCRIIGVVYPATISNDKSEPASISLTTQSLAVIRHILRHPAGIPAYRYMDYKEDKWRGRQRLALPTVLDADLQTLSSGHRLRNTPDLYMLRLCAQDKQAWKEHLG